MAVTDSKDKRSSIQRSYRYSEHYVAEIFTLWYRKAKPNPERLRAMIEHPDPATGETPSTETLRYWISEDFINRAVPIDNEVAIKLEQSLIADKFNMLREHAMAGRELASMGFDYLREHGIGTSRNAIQAVIQGIKVEKDSRGAPTILGKIDKMSDDELVDLLAEIVIEGEVEITPYDGDENVPDLSE